MISGLKIYASPSCSVAATAPTPLSRGGLGGVLRPRDLTLLKKLFSWRES